MPNTIDSALNGTLISQAALEAFTGSFAPMNAFTTDFDPAPASKSDTIHVPYVPAASAATDFAAATGYTRQDSTLQKKTITLNRHKFVSWTVTDLESAKSPVISMERFGRQKGYQLAKAVFQDVLSSVTLANFGAAAFTGLASTFDYADVVDIKGACDTAEIPENPRSLVLAAGHYNALLKDSVVKDLSVYGLNSNQTGRVGRLAGFDLFDSTLVPANGQNLVGFACYPSALIVAMRYLNPAGGGGDGVYRPVADENTGITLGYREWYDNDLGTRVAVLEAFYGFSVGEAAALKRLVSA